MALDSGSTPTSASSSTKSQAQSQTQSRSKMVSKSAALRRRRSKGGFASEIGSGSLEVANNASATSPSSSSPEHSSSTRNDNPAVILSNNSNYPQNKNINNTKIINSSQTQTISNNNISNDPASSSGKPCHAARLTLLCCQNAIRMGARTQLGLCPPGRARRELKAALRNKNRSNIGNRASTSSSISISISTRRSSSGQTFVTPDVGGYFGVDKMIGSETLEKTYPAKEEEFLVNTNAFDAESDEEASSGDDEDLIDLQELFIDIDGPQLQQNHIDAEKKYANLMEPLFTPIGDESALANSVNGPMGGGGGSGGKLPFNRRKIRYFDSITAQDTMTVRAYLNREMQRSKQREVMLLARHLKRAQRNQRRQLKEKRGGVLIASERNDLDTMDENEQQRTLALASVSKFEQNMTPAYAAALVIESLQMNKLESIEGMAKCYDGTIAAGIALLEINNDPTSSPSDDSSLSAGSGTHGKRAQIMGALTPLLISSLEQPSGDVIIVLAKLRRMCGTARYQRRFVQRVAPALIRPPRGALWCLKHQNDMEPILAAAELIFDSAFDIFSKGWYDRGQLLLADTKRAETLNTVAMQLKNLSSHPEENLTLELGHGSSTWRSNKYKSGNDPSKGAKEPLAEWEVIEVDRQIRVSISNIIAMDWSRVVVSKEAALSSASFQRSRSSGKRPSVLLQTTSSGEMNMSPKNTSPSTLSPIRQPNLKPQHVPPLFGSETGDGSTNQPSYFSANPDVQRERTKSPIPPGISNQNIPLSPPPPNREIEGRLPVDHFAQASSNLFPPSEQTIPRSPTPKQKDVASDNNTSIAVPVAVPPLPMSPKRTKNMSNNNSNTSNAKESIATFSDNSSSSSSPVHPQFGGERDRVPLSPPPAGVGTISDGVPHRPMSSTSSVSSSITGMSGIVGSGSQPSHYRMLTSTAAERKRTVAACRALRAQITRFEEAFIQLHGRPPKGASERAPLATTYAQYREWKRAIRADAACRIQALFRGASTRWMLLRSNNPQISKVVTTRAGRSGFAMQNDSAQSQTSVLDELSIPAEIVDHRQEGLLSNSGRGTPSMDMQVQGTGQTIVPQWGDQIVRRRSASNEFTSISPIPRPAASPIASSNSRTSGDLARLSLPDLQGRKRELKQQLKQYDMSFARRHGRMPVKAEKEPIRHLYERYNALKGHIGEIEQEGRRSSSPTTIPVLSSASPVITPMVSISPVGSDSDESTGRRSNNTSRRISPSSTSIEPTGSPTPTQDSVTLKAEKSRLHQMLRSFERDFFRENQRQVQSFADIRPVASQYRRYKEIKRAIAALQRGER